MNKLDKIFTKCKQENRATLIIFVSCGFPDMEQSEKLIAAAIDGGADIIELGVPFSDPMADGAIIRKASEIALQNGATLEKILQMAERLAKRYPMTGFVLFSYMNIIYNYGLSKLCQRLKSINLDGILAVDLPYEERAELAEPCNANNLHLISLISPVTPMPRAEKIISHSSGFIYCVNVLGVTGVRELQADSIVEHLAQLRKISNLPLAAGFGINDKKSAQQISQVADGIIVGSALLQQIFQETKAEKQLIACKNFVKQLSEAIRFISG